VVASVAVRTGAGDKSSGGEGGQGCGSLDEGEPAVLGLLVNRRSPLADVKVARRTKFGGIENQIRAISPVVQSRQQGNIYKAMPKSKTADKNAALYLDLMHCCPTQRFSGLYYFIMSAGQVFLSPYVEDITPYVKRPNTGSSLLLNFCFCSFTG
jgi:hypothetical protein